MFHQLLQVCRTLSAGACTANSFHTCRKKEKRKLDESLRKVKTLGQADEDIDDLAKWVTTSRTRGEEEKELAREEALAAVRRQAEEVFGHSLSLSVGSDPLCISHQFDWSFCRSPHLQHVHCWHVYNAFVVCATGRSMPEGCE